MKNKKNTLYTNVIQNHEIKSPFSHIADELTKAIDKTKDNYMQIDFDVNTGNKGEMPAAYFGIDFANGPDVTVEWEYRDGQPYRMLSVSPLPKRNSND